jgi:hypothetical protein
VVKRGYYAHVLGEADNHFKNPVEALKELKVKLVSFIPLIHAQHDSLNMMLCTDAASMHAAMGVCLCVQCAKCERGSVQSG